jgi:hypothetical protein
MPLLGNSPRKLFPGASATRLRFTLGCFVGRQLEFLNGFGRRDGGESNGRDGQI